LFTQGATWKETVVQPYDLYKRLREDLDLGDARVALELCLRLLTASSAEDLDRVVEGVRELRQKELIDPLDLLCYRLTAEAEERCLFLKATLEWARGVDPEASSIDIEPAAWTVTVRVEGEAVEVRSERAWDKMDADTDDVVVRVVPEGGKEAFISRYLTSLE
jgi:hypothetical protein